MRNPTKIPVHGKGRGYNSWKSMCRADLGNNYWNNYSHFQSCRMKSTYTCSDHIFEIYRKSHLYSRQVSIHALLRSYECCKLDWKACSAKCIKLIKNSQGCSFKTIRDTNLIFGISPPVNFFSGIWQGNMGHFPPTSNWGFWYGITLILVQSLNKS